MSSFHHKVKDFFSRDNVKKIIAIIANIYIRFVYFTSKIIRKGEYKNVLEYLKTSKGLTLISWHGRSIITPCEMCKMFKQKSKNKKKIYVLSSLHRDGKIAQSIIKTFGIEIIEGSTIDKKKGSKKNKKSLSSLRETMRALLLGNICTLAPDGPRGPANKLNSKITDIIQRTNTGICCVSISYKRKIQLKTWDNLQIPFPFNKIIIEYSQIIFPTKKDNLNEINLKLENNLNLMIKNNDIF